MYGESANQYRKRLYRIGVNTNSSLTMWKSVTTIVVISNDQNRCEGLNRKKRNDTSL